MPGAFSPGIPLIVAWARAHTHHDTASTFLYRGLNASPFLHVRKFEGFTKSAQRFEGSNISVQRFEGFSISLEVISHAACSIYINGCTRASPAGWLAGL